MRPAAITLAINAQERMMTSFFIEEERVTAYSGGCLFTQSHADHVIGLQDERSLMKANQPNVLDTVLANGRSSVFSSTGKAAYRFSDVLL